jgi:hypothetical protein
VSTEGRVPRAEFRIEFTHLSEDPELSGDWLGEIRMAGHRDVFIASTMVWQREEYEVQWHSTLRGLVAGVVTDGLLVNNLEGNSTSWFVQAYAVHRMPGGRIAIREQFWLPEWLPAGFEPARLDLIAGPREPLGVGESAPSEWTVESASVERFLDSQA